MAIGCASSRGGAIPRTRATARREETGFPDFVGAPNDYYHGVHFFLEKFKMLNRVPDRTIYSHVTCATDTGNARGRRRARAIGRPDLAAPRRSRPSWTRAATS